MRVDCSYNSFDSHGLLDQLATIHYPYARLPSALPDREQETTNSESQLMGKLPFVPRIFWTVLVVVAVLVVGSFVVLGRFTDYERTTTDVVGSAISGVIFSYLVHLWLLPGDSGPDEDSDAMA